MLKVVVATIITLAVPTWGQAQSSPVIFKEKAWSGDTAFWYRWQSKIAQKVKLRRLTVTQNVFRLRYWAHGQVVDIVSDDGKTFNGMLVNYTEPYSEDDWKRRERKSSKLIYNVVPLDTAVVKSVVTAYSDIRQMPSDNLISGWEQGNDGITYVFEEASPSTYSFKTYWTPTAQNDSLTEAKLVAKFTARVGALLKLRQRYEAFQAELPDGSYTHGAVITTIRDSERKGKLKLKSSRKPGSLLP